jgi:hypothetical protein
MLPAAEQLSWWLLVLLVLLLPSKSGAAEAVDSVRQHQQTGDYTSTTPHSSRSNRGTTGLGVGGWQKPRWSSASDILHPDYGPWRLQTCCGVGICGGLTVIVLWVFNIAIQGYSGHTC